MSSWLEIERELTAPGGFFETVDEAVAGLRAPKRLPTAQGSGSAPEVAFLLPGQGAQAAGMGRGLYGTEPVFRREIDLARGRPAFSQYLSAVRELKRVPQTASVERESSALLPADVILERAVDLARSALGRGEVNERSGRPDGPPLPGLPNETRQDQRT